MLNNLPEDLDRLLDGGKWEPNQIGRSGVDVFRIEGKDQNLFLKVRTDSKAERLRREHELLHWLNGKLPVPNVLYYEDRGDKEWLLMSEISGYMPFDERFQNKERVIRDLAQGLRQIHSVPIGHCPYHRYTEELIDEAERRVRENLVDVNDFDEHNQGKSPEELFGILLETRPKENDYVFAHGDYCVPNIILTENGVNGYIDWGRGGVADRHLDLALAKRSITYNFGEKWVPGFFKAYGQVAVDEEKLAFFQLLDEFF